MKRVLLLLSLFSTAFIACSSTKSTGKTVSLELKSNPSTGFSWECEIQDPEIAEIVSDNYRADKLPTGVMGSGGTQIFKFQCKKPGSTRLTLTYRRPWTGGETAQVRTAELTVDKGLHGSISLED